MSLHWRRESAHPGTCRDCMLRRDVYRVSRSGGGTYARGGRSYRTSICAECALGLLAGSNGHRDHTLARFSVLGIERVVASLGTVEAAEVLDRHRQQHDNHNTIREASR